MGYLTLLVALLISGVAAWYSIAGLAAIFAGAKLSIVIMGGVLEIGKLVTASWLYRNWRDVPFLLKSYLTFAVVVLMFITSMGIFGYLSKAHIDQTIQQGGNNELRIEMLERKIQRQQSIISDSEKVVAQLDEAVATLQEYDRIRGPDGAIAARASQAEERQALNETIETAYDVIESIQIDLLPIKKEQISLEAEVGPIRYVAELIYGEADQQLLERAVRWMILIIIFVFDPLAVLLLIAANMTILQNRNTITKQKVAVVQQTDTGTWDDFFEEERIVPDLDTEKSAEDRLKEVDKRLKVIYNTQSLNDKHEKRDLERLRKKLIERINLKRG
jgi:hypothetical protein